MILFNRNRFNVLVGNSKLKESSLTPYSNLSLDFFSDISKLILKNGLLKRYPDLVTFAFWCRRGNLLKKNLIYKDNYLRRNLGFVLHVPPSNVPITLAYSFALGVLSGNANILRVSNPKLDNLYELMNIIKSLFKKKKI